MNEWKRILWIKSVTQDGDFSAYSGEEPGVRSREPRVAGDAFDLHATPEDGASLAEPAVGDIIALTQHEQLTHLVEVTGADVVPRPKRTMRPKTRDARFSVQRECVVVELLDFERAPLVEEAFGFDPDAKGGEVFAIVELPAFHRSEQPLWAVQRRVATVMTRARLAPKRG